MLIALVNNNETSEDTPDSKGDIMVVKLQGATWGKVEKKSYALVQWEDAELEKKLLNKNDINAFIIYPYKEYEEYEAEDGKTRKITRLNSYLRVDTKELKGKVLTDFLNKKEEVETIAKKDYKILTANDSPSIKGGVVTRAVKEIDSKKQPINKVIK